jgi:hypothetical protein
MDLIVEDLENISSFLNFFETHHKDLNYFHKHFPKILLMRNQIAQQIDLLTEDARYSYSHAKISRLHQINEKIFSLLEGLAGGVDPWNEKVFNQFKTACEKELSRFDQDLTP